MPSLLLALFASTPHPLPSLTQHTERVSVSSAGIEGDRASFEASISADGRFVAFQSESVNLVPGGDTNHAPDIFVHDRQSGQTTRVSVSSRGIQGNSASYSPSISSDGRFVAFYSGASNLVPGDTNGFTDVFVHDRQTGNATRVSMAMGGFEGNGWAYYPSISSDGRFVAFESDASNLVPGDTNGFTDVFVHDCLTGQTTRASVNSAGPQAVGGDSYSPSISADGRFVTFTSSAYNLVPGDLNGEIDIFVHDKHTSQTTRVSVATGGLESNWFSTNSSISSDGRLVAFQSSASNLVPGDSNRVPDIFVHDRQTGQTTRISVDSGGLQGNDWSMAGKISADGRMVAFGSLASNLVPGDTNRNEDVFVHDRLSGQTARVSIDSEGRQGECCSIYDSRGPSISSDGRFVAFESFASNFVPEDRNGTYDIFVHDRQTIAPALAASGSCPGPVTLHLDAVSPEGNVAFAIGGSGSFTIPSGPCAGSTLDLASPQLGPVIRASWHGTITRGYQTTPSMCGLTVQVLDIQTCRTSNTVVL